MKKTLFALTLISITFNFLFSKNLLLKKIDSKTISKYEQIYSEIYCDSVIIPILKGSLKIGNHSIETTSPFYLNKDVNWEFTFNFKHDKNQILINDNLYLKWYKKNPQGRWIEINENKFLFQSKGKSSILVKYTKKDEVYDEKKPIKPVFLCGFNCPLYILNDNQNKLSMSIKEISPHNIMLNLQKLDSSLLKKTIRFQLSTYNGKINEKLKILNLNDANIKINTQKIRTKNNLYKIQINVFLGRKIIYSKKHMVNDNNIIYEAPFFKEGEEKISLYPVQYTPDFSNLDIYINPKLQNKLFHVLKNNGYNSIIINSKYLNPIIINSCLKNNIKIFTQNNNYQYYHLFEENNWFSTHLLNGVIWDYPCKTRVDFSNGIHFENLHISSQIIPQLTSKNFAPFYKLEFNSFAIKNKIANLYKTRGGLIVNSGFNSGIKDTLLSQKKYFKEVINSCKLMSPLPISACYFSLTSYSLIFPFMFSEVKNNNYFHYPNTLLDSLHFKSKISADMLNFIKSPVPDIIEENSNTHSHEFIFILIGVLNFFAFIFYLMHLKSFKIYFFRAIQKTHGFFMDLNEKIAVPWSETIFLALFTTIGISTTLGAYFSIFNKNLISNHILNLIVIKPQITNMVFQIINKPSLLILSCFILYFSYLIIIALSIKISFFIFQKPIKFKHCFALSVWSHVLFALYIFLGLIAYNSIKILHIGYEFWVAGILIWILSYFRLNKAIFITSGFKYYKIYFLSFLIIGIIILLLYSTDYPLVKILEQISSFALK